MIKKLKISPKSLNELLILLKEREKEIPTMDYYKTKVFWARERKKNERKDNQFSLQGGKKPKGGHERGKTSRKRR